MTFTVDQQKKLAAPLDPKHVRSRSQAGVSLAYIEGWHAIAEANRIFGFDSWERETIETKLVVERETKIGRDQAAGWRVTYTAKVRVTIHAGDRKLVREGSGAGHGIDRDLGQAHESALKESETDAMKRAFMLFGNPFGLALYDKTRANVGVAAEDGDSAGEVQSAPSRKDPPAKAAPAKKPAPKDDALPDDFVKGKAAEEVIANVEKAFAAATSVQNLFALRGAFLAKYKGRISNNRVDYVLEMADRRSEEIETANADETALPSIRELKKDLAACVTREQLKGFSERLTPPVLAALADADRAALHKLFKAKREATAALKAEDGDIDGRLVPIFDHIDGLASGDEIDAFETGFKKGAIALGDMAWGEMKAPEREQIVARIVSQRELVAERRMKEMA